MKILKSIFKTIAKAVSLFWIGAGSLVVLTVTILTIGFLGLLMYGFISAMI